MSAAGRPEEEPLAAGNGEIAARLTELLDGAQASARGMLEAEEALNALRERLRHTDNDDARVELEAEALDQVERQLKLTRERRRQLDGIEGQLWARRNSLERFLIRARGSAWWHARAGGEQEQPEIQEHDATWNA
ncbi:MAG TPA: hypothetical protein VG010_04730 [Solirubrobacteraceae bacterium]|nr:hypothetical protein [Solirubrobacteraceae bacterium]